MTRRAKPIRYVLWTMTTIYLVDAKNGGHESRSGDIIAVAPFSRHRNYPNCLKPDSDGDTRFKEVASVRKYRPRDGP